MCTCCSAILGSQMLSASSSSLRNRRLFTMVASSCIMACRHHETMSNKIFDHITTEASNGVDLRVRPADMLEWICCCVSLRLLLLCEGGALLQLWPGKAWAAIERQLLQHVCYISLIP